MWMPDNSGLYFRAFLPLARKIPFHANLSKPSIAIALACLGATSLDMVSCAGPLLSRRSKPLLRSTHIYTHTNYFGRLIPPLAVPSWKHKHLGSAAGHSTLGIACSTVAPQRCKPSFLHPKLRAKSSPIPPRDLGRKASSSTAAWQCSWSIEPSAALPSLPPFPQSAVDIVCYPSTCISSPPSTNE